MKKNYILLTLCVCFFSCAVNAAEVADKDKEEIADVWTALTRKNCIEPFLLSAYGSRKSLNEYLFGYALLNSVVNFKASLEKRYGKDAWDDYKAALIKIMSPSYNFNNNLIFLTKEAGGEIITENSDNKLKMVFGLYDNRYNLNLDKTFAADRISNPYFTLSLKMAWDLGNKIASDKDYDSSILSLKEAMSRPLCYPPRETIDLKYICPSEGLTYFLTMDLNRQQIKGNDIFVHTSYILNIKPLKGNELTITVVGLDNYSFFENNIDKLTFTVEVDERGNILKSEDDKNLNKHQKWAKTFILENSFIPLASKTVHLKEQWKAKRQAFWTDENFKEFDRSNLFKIDYWFNKGDIVNAKISSYYNYEENEKDGLCYVSGKRDVVYNVTKQFLIRSSCNRISQKGDNGNLSYIMEANINCILVDIKLEEIEKRYQLSRIMQK